MNINQLTEVASNREISWYKTSNACQALAIMLTETSLLVNEDSDHRLKDTLTLNAKLVHDAIEAAACLQNVHADLINALHRELKDNQRAMS